MSDDVTIEVELTDAQALALAQLVKRLTWSDLRGCAIDDQEAYTMRDAIDRVRSALADCEPGYAPR